MNFEDKISKHQHRFWHRFARMVCPSPSVPNQFLHTWNILYYTVPKLPRICPQTMFMHVLKVIFSRFLWHNFVIRKNIQLATSELYCILSLHCIYLCIAFIFVCCITLLHLSSNSLLQSVCIALQIVHVYRVISNHLWLHIGPLFFLNIKISKYQ